MSEKLSDLERLVAATEESTNEKNRENNLRQEQNRLLGEILRPISSIESQSAESKQDVKEIALKIDAVFVANVDRSKRSEVQVEIERERQLELAKIQAAKKIELNTGSQTHTTIDNVTGGVVGGQIGEVVDGT